MDAVLYLTSPREAQLRFRHRLTGGQTTCVLHVFHVDILPPARFTAYPLIQNIIQLQPPILRTQLESRCHPRQLPPKGQLQLDPNHLDQLQMLDDPLELLLDLDLRLDRRNREYLSELVPVRVVVELRPNLKWTSSLP
jgi:hypothetical protein